MTPIIFYFASNHASNAFEIYINRTSLTGVFDTSFGDSGTYTCSIADIGSMEIRGIKVNSSGDIFVAINNIQKNNGYQAHAVVKLTTTGAANVTYGVDGYALYTFPFQGSGSWIYDMILQCDESVILAGSYVAHDINNGSNNTSMALVFDGNGIPTRFVYQKSRNYCKITRLIKPLMEVSFSVWTRTTQWLCR